MLDFVRTHRRLMFLVLLILVFPSFVFFGVQGYSRFMDGSHDAARVGDTVITTSELDTRVREQTERLRQMLGAQYDPRQFEGPQMRRDVLDGIIQQRVMVNEASRANLSVADSKVRETIEQIPAVAQLRKPDGKFDTDAYIKLLAAQGMTPEQFDARLRSELVLQQIPQSIVSSAFVPKSLVDRLIEARDQQREVQALLFKPADYAAKVTVDDKAIQAYYDAHQQEFAVLEQVKAEYVVFSGEEMMKQIPVTPEQLKEYYDQNAARFKTEEQRRAAHILIKLPDNAKPADKDAAKKRAEEVLAEVRKSPGSFAELAKKYSGDPGSAAQGGELGFLAKGATVPPFENALFALKQPGDISDVVESDFGFHIIKLEDVKGGGVQSLDAVKPELEREVRTQLANKKYTELADAFSNGVEDQSDSLKPVADKLKLQIQTADHVTRVPNPALGNSPINNEKVLKALFADDVTKNHRNTQAVQVGPTTLVAARAVEYRPATVKKLADVREQVKAKVLAEQSAALAKKAGEEKLAALKQSNSAEGFGTAQTLSRQQAQGTPPAALVAILRADAAKLPVTIGVDLGAQGYALYRINKVLPPANVDPARRAADAQQLTQAAGQADFNAYYEALKARSKVKINGSVVDAAKPAASSDDGS
ncbi:SurA N-terminal domain-containing protein [Ralstonia pseudosolanacearum]